MVFVIGYKRIPVFYLMMFVLGYVFSSQDFMAKIPKTVFSAMFLLFCLIAGYVGKYALGIYLCHFMLVDIGFLSRTEVCLGVWLQVFVLSVLAILIALCCIGIQKVFSIFPYLGGILYGKWKGGGR